MTDLSRPQRRFRKAAAVLALLCACGAAGAQGRNELRPGDYIIAVVNQELVTAVEVELRIARGVDEAKRSGARLPPEAEIRRQAVESLIEERVIVTYARDSGMKVDELEVDRAVQNVAAQNQLTLDQLRERLRREGIDYPRLRASLRDQIMVERLREREVLQRIRITDGDVDKFLEQQRASVSADIELNIAQILVSVPEGASESDVAARRARADQALARVKAGEAFDAVAREMSEDGNRQKGGEIGLRPSSRLPDPFVEMVRGLQPGQVAPAPLRTGAGFHLLKLLERKDAAAIRITQTRARHILLRTSAQLSAETASRRLADYRRQIESGERKFEDVAKQFSEDGSAAQGGDLGWTAPGVMVPEFEEAMDKLQPGGLSPPVVSRFGVHLIQVLERRQVALDAKQVREQARNVLREQKFDDAYAEWAKDLRARAYIEMREPPQ